MRLLTISTVIAGAAALALWDSTPEIEPFDFDHGVAVTRAGFDKQKDSFGCMGQLNCEKPILDLELYVDPDYSFSVAIPAGWRKIVAAEDIANDNESFLESGYAVGFESPRAGRDDQFADYILIEVLPGDDIGLFVASDEQRKVLQSGSEQIAYDRLEIDGTEDDASDVDLVIFQHGVRATGYTLGFYAIGEPANEQAMFDAFQILLRTYNQKSAPFMII